MVRQADTDGTVILAKEGQLTVNGTAVPTVIVNPTLLSVQPVETSQGSALQAPLDSTSAGAEQMYQRALAQRVLLIAVGAGILAIVITSVATASVHIARHRRRIFVRHIHGWPMARIIALPLIGDLFLSAGLAAWGLSRQARAAQLVAQGFPAPDPHLAMTAVLVAVLGAATSTLALVRTARRSILDSTADA